MAFSLSPSTWQAIRQGTPAGTSRPLQPLVYPPYDPANPRLYEFHASTAKVRLLLAANRFGKSESGAYELLSLARRYPGQMFWACSNTTESIGLFVWPKLKKYLAPHEIHTIAWTSRVKEIPSQVRLVNGSVLVFKTYDQRREKFQGAMVKGVWLDEECDHSIFTECLARTIDCQGVVFLTMTPLKGLTWVYDHLYDIPNQDTDDLRKWEFTLYDSKYISQEEIARLEALYTADEIQQRIYGRFVKLEGAVWKEFYPERHICDPFDIPADWRRIRAIDFGYEHLFVCLWLAQSPEGQIVVYREHAQAGTLLQDHARVMHAPQEEIEATVADHDAQDRAELEAQEIYTLPANKEIDLGLQIVNRCFKAGSLSIFASCSETIRQAKIYHFHPKTGKPEKKDDDTQDALRYGVMYLMQPQTEPVWRN